MDGSPDHLLIEVDLVQAEWVVVAYLTNDPNMLEVVEKNLDAHVRTGALLSGMPEAWVKIEKDLVGSETDPDLITALRRKLPTEITSAHRMGKVFLTRSMSVRQAGKKSNHALNYHMEWARFGLENEMDAKDSKRCVSFYREVAYPGLKTWWRAVEEQMRRDRTLITCHGDKRRFLGFWDDHLMDQAYAFVPQATVGRVTNKGLNRIYHDRSLGRYDPLANVHDSIVGQAYPRSWLELFEITSQLSRHLAEPCCYSGKEFVLRREVKLGLNWRDMASVSALTLEGLQLAYESAIKAAS